MIELAIVYAITSLWRLHGLRTMWNIPRFHGPNYCFSRQVPEGFYAGPGKPLLQRFRRRLAWPYVLEAIAVTALLAAGLWKWAFLTILPGVLLMLVTRTSAIRALAKEAAPYFTDSPEAAPVTISLQPRTISRYSVAWLEGLLGVATLVAIACLWNGYTRSGEDALSFWTMPFLVLYGHAGCLLLKRAVIEWRLGAPTQPEHTTLRDQSRRLLLATFDWLRVALAVVLLSAGILNILPIHALGGKAQNIVMLYPVLAVWAAMMVHLNVMRRRFLAAGKRLKPAPRLAPVPAAAPRRAWGSVCFDRDHPAIWIPNENGRYLLNAASQRAQIMLLYAAGWVVIAAWIAARATASSI